jgi:SAM-dependent methyltransferase
VEREWKRYEGTAQRDLYRELRERFLVRHSVSGGWVLDLGAGPGRFTARLGGEGTRRVALDLSREALRFLGEVWPGPGKGARALPDRIQGDAERPPLASGAFSLVAVLGNTLGFAGAGADRILGAAGSLVGPGGTMVLEVAPGSGERSRYLTRLPPGSVRRLLRAPVRAVLPRIEREGYRVEPRRKAREGPFRRIGVGELSEQLSRSGWSVGEVLAVGPALGPDALRLESVHADPKAWNQLLLIEEDLGHRTQRWKDAAAVLVAAVRAAEPPGEGRPTRSETSALR